MVKLTKKYSPSEDHIKFLSWSKKRKKATLSFKIIIIEAQKHTINPYAMMETLFAKFDDDEVIVTGDGTAVVVSYKMAIIKNKTRYFHTVDVHQWVGISSQQLVLLLLKKEQNCVYYRRWSIMLNIQELQTIIHHKMPIKIFVLNNDGYHSIRQSQKNYYKGKEIGCGPRSGISFPNFKKVCESFGIKAYKVDSLTKLRNNIDKVSQNQKGQL